MSDESKSMTRTGPAFGGGQSLVPGRKPSSRGEDIKLSRLVFFTGTKQHVKEFGPHEDGEFLDEIDCTSFGKSVRIAIIGVVGATYSKWVNTQSLPVYFYKSWAEVPPELHHEFEWDGDKAPVGTETINVVVALLDKDHNYVAPYVFSFKRTSMPCWDGKRGIEAQENDAAKKDPDGFGACVYELSSEADKNAAKQDYTRLTCRMVQKLISGNPLREPLREAREGFAALKAQADAMSEAGDDELPPV